MVTTHAQALDALLVGYEDQENLGLRSIMGSLESEGFRVALQPFLPGNPAPVVAAAQAHTPALIGFSIIFQYTLDEFAALATALRQAKIGAHFTAGGHFPSLRPRQALELMPHLDSVVCFEGERTAVELLHTLNRPEEWGAIRGLAFRRNGDLFVNPPRPLIADLDGLPLPVRGNPGSLPRGIHVASILASRGCLYNCSFCSIRQFYGSAPGPLRRVRSPKSVVAEMEQLFSRDDVRFFIFQDDDFAARSPQQREWIDAYLRALRDSGLSEQVRWKISCRVDDIDGELLARCRDLGLIAVYLGVESGSPTGLRTLNKQVTVEQNRAAIETLKRLQIAFDMGFMLFDPDSTIDTIRENLDFLRWATGDGACPANFCKMLPYAGTPIEARLRQEGRLGGTATQPDYDFVDPRLDWFALFAARVFRFRNFDQLGLVERLRVALFDEVLARTFERASGVDQYRNDLRQVAARSNKLVLDTLEDALRFITSRDADSLAADWPLLGTLANRAWQAETRIQSDLDAVLATHSPELLRAFAEEFQHRFDKEEPLPQPSGPTL